MKPVEIWGKVPPGISYVSERQPEGWDIVTALVEGITLPVMASDEIDDTYLIRDKDGKPMRIIEPAMLS